MLERLIKSEFSASSHGASTHGSTWRHARIHFFTLPRYSLTDNHLETFVLNSLIKTPVGSPTIQIVLTIRVRYPLVHLSTDCWSTRLVTLFLTLNHVCLGPTIAGCANILLPIVPGPWLLSGCSVLNMPTCVTILSQGHLSGTKLRSEQVPTIHTYLHTVCTQARRHTYTHNKYIHTFIYM